ncbi:hypothetical protein HMPREF9371_1802 [Neisseria shayeganii 871]|uniref:Uncharacterized protein n=1 Tax=Neisseria shayeganii 871 TaxID=1032488 RepID=G4CJL2_9NEIS|nr:hypothetical protein HMPREF9371_1802 [Neisseria shayeganii 871]
MINHCCRSLKRGMDGHGDGEQVPKHTAPRRPIKTGRDCTAEHVFAPQLLSAPYAGAHRSFRRSAAGLVTRFGAAKNQAT